VPSLPEPHVLEGHYRDHMGSVSGWSELQVLELLAAKEAEVGRLREALMRLADAAGDSVATGVIAAHLDSAYDHARAALTQGETK